jgi:uncharacterized heparinase superfamily protein
VVTDSGSDTATASGAARDTATADTATVDDTSHCQPLPLC